MQIDSGDVTRHARSEVESPSSVCRSYLATPSDGNLERREPSELTCAQQENAAYAFRGARLLLPQGLTALRCSFLYRFDCRCAACIPLAKHMPNTRIASNSRITDLSRRQVGNTKCQISTRLYLELQTSRAPFKPRNANANRLLSMSTSRLPNLNAISSLELQTEQSSLQTTKRQMLH